LRGEGRGEGLPSQFGQEVLEYSLDIFDDFVVPNADYPITEGG